MIELLSVRAPSPEKKLKLLTEIAEEHDLDWDPAGTEAEFNKSPEDLLASVVPFSFLSQLVVTLYVLVSVLSLCRMDQRNLSARQNYPFLN